MNSAVAEWVGLFPRGRMAGDVLFESDAVPLPGGLQKEIVHLTNLLSRLTETAKRDDQYRKFIPTMVPPVKRRLDLITLGVWTNEHMLRLIQNVQEVIATASLIPVPGEQAAVDSEKRSQASADANGELMRLQQEKIDRACKKIIEVCDKAFTIDSSSDEISCVAMEILHACVDEIPDFSEDRIQKIHQYIAETTTLKQRTIELLHNEGAGSILGDIPIAKVRSLIETWPKIEQACLRDAEVNPGLSVPGLEPLKRHIELFTQGCSPKKVPAIQTLFVDRIASLVAQADKEMAYTETPRFREIYERGDPEIQQNVGDHPAIGQFLDAHKDNLTVKVFSLAVDLFGFTTQLVRDERIVSPNEAALKMIAKRYANKYGIHIEVLSLCNLADRLHEIAQQTLEPTYVGFITARRGDLDKYHVAPLLAAFFPGEQPQFIFMDILGTEQGSFNNSLLSALPCAFQEESLVARTTSRRQADLYSCRIGAITLLRNALLSLAAQENPREYWQRAFQNAGKYLPPEWTYVEQIQAAPEQAIREAIAIRDRFSQSQTKRENPRRAYQHIRSTSETVQVKYTLNCLRSWLSHIIPEPEIEALKAPDGAQLEFAKDPNVYLSFTIEKSINSYLLRKALREEKKLTVTQKCS